MNKNNFDQPRKTYTFRNILLIGALTMLYAEVAAGSAGMWFLDPFFILYTFFLYALHFLFYLNLAIKTKKTQFWQLYLWGMLFGLYEGPITQVIWAGYPSEGKPMWGSFLGVAWQEFSTIIFFWHPLMSFIIPLLTLEIFILHQYPESTQENILLPNHLSLLKKFKKKRFLIGFYIILLSTGQLMATSFNLITTAIAVIGSMLIVLFFYWIEKRAYYDKETGVHYWSIYSFELGKKGFIILIIVMLTYIYGLGIYAMAKELPGRWPTNPVSYLSVLALILLILLLLWKTPSHDEIDLEHAEDEELPTTKTLYSFWLEWIAFMFLFGFIPAIGFILGITFYLFNFLVGFVLFLLCIKWALFTIIRH